MKKLACALFATFALSACHTPESNLERLCETANAVSQDANVGQNHKGSVLAEKEGTYLNFLNNKEYAQAFNEIAVAQPFHKSEPIHAYAKKNGVDWKCPAVDKILGPPRTATATKS